MRPMEAFILLCVVAFLAWFVWVVCSTALRSIQRLISGAPAQVIPDLEAAKKLLETPRQVVGTNEWVHTVCETRVCPAPMAANNLDVHDRNAPGHDAKKCKHCQARPGFSGVSYRSN